MSQCDWWAPHDGGMVFCVGDSGHRGKHTSTLGSFTEWRPRTTRVMELTAEVTRLRKALEMIATAVIKKGGAADRLRSIARAALATAKAKGG